MRVFGIWVLVLGVLAVFGAMVMDVSVPSGVGRVNNLGLMAERQNFTLIGGVMLIIGLLMIIAGRREASSALDSSNSTACPMCAETIKKAAIQCKHCGASVVAANVVQGITESNQQSLIANAHSELNVKEYHIGYWIIAIVSIVVVFIAVSEKISSQ
ncbi:hypothetical protein BI292_14865 [Pseudomonas sp. 43NM1]|uniref:hypothetical protein n=1 Tax=Pseudomonas sp. 43NM1 TaxID=1904755 RepID=UPI000C326400|nr:hypothetical protein [Pseudomonas sp. 43NM1]PKH22144.1 hypothetical protein BI292_14865 [Pseudomonas sp. 43NM1]